MQDNTINVSNFSGAFNFLAFLRLGLFFCPRLLSLGKCLRVHSGELGGSTCGLPTNYDFINIFRHDILGYSGSEEVELKLYKDFKII